MSRRTCAGRTSDKQQCRQAPLLDSEYCFWHDPDRAEEAAEARRLGGTRRRREGVVGGAYGYEGLKGTADLRRLYDIAAFDALGLENSIARVRALVALVTVGAKLLETGDFEGRLEALESAIGGEQPG